MQTCKYITGPNQCGLAVTRQAWLAPLSHHPPFEIHFCQMHVEVMQTQQLNIFWSKEEALTYQVTGHLALSSEKLDAL